MLITIIPHRASSSSTPTLNINGLGAKEIRRRYSYTNNSATTGYTSSWLSSGDPQLLQYDGTYWIAVGANKPYTSDLSSSVSVSKGGTGKTSWSSYRLIYPSSTTALTQLAFPTTAGSFLRQGTSGKRLERPQQKKSGTSVPCLMRSTGRWSDGERCRQA